MLYGAVQFGGNVYRVKTTVKRVADQRASYFVTCAKSKTAASQARCNDAHEKVPGGDGFGNDKDRLVPSYARSDPRGVCIVLRAVKAVKRLAAKELWKTRDVPLATAEAAGAHTYETPARSTSTAKPTMRYRIGMSSIWARKS